MNPKTLTTCLGLVVGMVLIAGSGASAHHSYVLTVQELNAGLEKAQSLTQKGFFLIDVRSSQEHIAGVIPGTDLNIEYTEIEVRHREIGARLEDHIVVYCQTGRRSNIAAETLADLGYRHVYNVQGSMNAWMDAGYPMYPPAG